MVDRLTLLGDLERRHDGPIPAHELAMLPPSPQTIDRAWRNEKDASSRYWMKLAWIATCATCAKEHMYGDTPLEEALSELQLALDDARQAARKLDAARARLDEVEGARERICGPHPVAGMEVTDDRPIPEAAIRLPVNLRPRSEGRAGVNHGAGYCLIEAMPEAQALQIVTALNALATAKGEE